MTAAGDGKKRETAENENTLSININKARFLNICDKINVEKHQRGSIGTYSEKRTHLILKHYFEDDEENMEVPYLGHVCDIKNGDKIYEIQTGNFGSMRKKLEAFLSENEVTIIYPIAKIRRLCWLDPATGEMISKRRSPKIKDEFSLLPELIYIMPFLQNPNLRFAAVLMDIDEYRWLNGWSRDKKRGSHRYETIPNELLGITLFKSPEDFRFFIPETLPREFTITEFAKLKKTDYRTAQRSVKVLQAAGVISETGKRGRCKLFAETEKTDGDGGTGKADGDEPV